MGAADALPDWTSAGVTINSDILVLRWWYRAMGGPPSNGTGYGGACANVCGANSSRRSRHWIW